MKNNIREKPKTCVIYCRVSSPKKAQEGDSLDKQTGLCMKYASQKGLKVLGEPYQESYSGRADSRPKLDEMMGFLFRNQGKVGYVIVFEISRLTRGGSSSYASITEKIRSLGVEVRDTFGIIQEEINIMAEYGDLADNYKFAIKRSSKISEQVYAQVKQDQIDEQLARLIGRQIDLTKLGYWIGTYPYGFRSEKQRETSGDGKKRSILILKPDEAIHVQEIFRLRAEGILSDTEIVKKINSMGYKSRKRIKRDKDGVHAIGRMGEKPLTEKQMEIIIQNPTYAGIVCKMWTRRIPIKAMFDGLVDIETWNKANRGRVYLKHNDDDTYELLRNYDEKKRFKTKVSIEYPYKHVIMCPLCGDPFWASAPKGKSGKTFPMYHCAGDRNKKPKHKHYSVPQSDFNQIVEQFVEKLSFTKEYHGAFELIIKDVYRKQHKNQISISQERAENVKEKKVRLQTLYEKLERATSDVVERKLEGDIEKLDEEIKHDEEHRNKSEATEHDFASYMKHARFLLEHPSEILLKARKKEDQRAIWSLVFEELPTYEELKTGTPKLSLFFKTKDTTEGVLDSFVRDARLELATFPV